MAQKNFILPLGKSRLHLKIADELWTSTLANGEKTHHLVQLGWTTCSDSPGVIVCNATLLWLSLHFAFFVKEGQK